VHRNPIWNASSPDEQTGKQGRAHCFASREQRFDTVKVQPWKINATTFRDFKQNWLLPLGSAKANNYVPTNYNVVRHFDALSKLQNLYQLIHSFKGDGTPD
jgi:hypothetical protein